MEGFGIRSLIIIVVDQLNQRAYLSVFSVLTI